MSLRIVKRVGSDFWYVRGTYRGRPVFASTKETDKAAGERFKDELEVRIARDDSVKCASATFGQATELYLEYRDAPKKDRDALKRIVGMIGTAQLGEIRQHIIFETAIALYPNGTAATRNRQAIGLIASVLHYAAENDLCPYIRVRKFKEKAPEPRSIAKEEAEKLIAGAAHPRLKLLLIFLFCQGWRISDAVALRWEDIDFDAQTARYHIRKIDEWRMMPLHARVLAMLAPVAEPTGRIFPWKDRHSVYGVVRALCKNTGVQFTPHMARHSFATWLVNDGVTLPEIMEAGGWRDHKSVLRYARVDQARARRTINRIGESLAVAPTEVKK